MLYEIFYQRITDEYPIEIKFMREIEMEGYYNIWLSDEDYYFCRFYYCSQEYIPKWIK